MAITITTDSIIRNELKKWEMWSPSVKRTQKVHLRKEVFGRILQVLKMVLVEIYVRVNCLDVPKLTEKLLEKGIGVWRFMTLGVLVYTTGLRIRAKRSLAISGTK